MTAKGVLSNTPWNPVHGERKMSGVGVGGGGPDWSTPSPSPLPIPPERTRNHLPISSPQEKTQDQGHLTSAMSTADSTQIFCWQ